MDTSAPAILTNCDSDEVVTSLPSRSPATAFLYFAKGGGLFSHSGWESRHRGQLRKRCWKLKQANRQAFASYTTTIYSYFAYRDWLGSVHPFNGSYVTVTASQAAQTYCGIQNSTTGPLTGYSTDNTGFYLNANQGQASVLSPAGVNSDGAPVDSNGNYVSQTVVNSTETDWTDTAGHLALKVMTNTSNPNIQYEWQDSSGNYTSASTSTVLRTLTNIKTNFACTGVGEYSGTANLPTEIDLSNGQKYFITYEPTPANSGYYTGRVKRVTLPTGGYYEYDYPTTAGDGIVCADASVNSLTRLTNDGTTTNTWTFSRVAGPTTVTAPQMPYDTAANNSVYTFSSSQQTSAKFYQGAVLAANLKRTVNTTWATNGSPATQITILEDGATENEVETVYDSYGNLTSLKEHDWGNNSPGSILRTTAMTYLGTSPYITANILNLLTSVTVTDNTTNTIHSLTNITYDESAYDNYVCVTSAAQHNNTNFGCSFTTRGNATTVTSYTTAATQAGPVTHHSYYDNLGNLVRADLDCCQSKNWLYSVATNYSFPDSATRGSSPGTQLTASAIYNGYTGLVATSKDENGQATNYAFDNLKRLTNIQRPDNTNLTWAYNDVAPASVTSGVPTQGSSVQKTTNTVDGLGRSITRAISDGTTTYSIVATQYDPLGRTYKSSNPYTSSASYWTAYQFDALGRPTYAILPDSSQTTFTFATNTAKVTDPAGKTRKSVADGLGRMSSVYEPDPSNGNTLTLQTSYSYNIFDLLTGVTQGSQTRTYAYDDLGRVTTVKIPETNQVATQFQYNNFGLVTQRTDPRAVITTYGYDNLNRLTGISYNVGSTGVTATPSVGLNYDQGGSAAFALGRPTSMTDGVGSETYTYNNLGEMTQFQKIIGATTYTTSYTYNLAGQLSSITYPSLRVVQQNFDTIGRVCSVGNSGSTCSSGTTFATGYAYNAALQITGFNYGNGVVAAIGYTPDRLLLQSLAFSKGASTLFSANYWYKTDSTNCPTAASGNNGQIQCITDSVDSGRTVSYAYDSLYRLTSAVTNGSTAYPKWGLSMTYDRYGNRSAQSVTAGSGPSSSVSPSASTNQLTGSPYAYDTNGNMTNDGSNTLVYDAENRLLSATNGSASGTYSYDGNSLRVKKVSGSTTTVYVFSGAKVIAEYDNGAAPTAPTREYIYSGGALLAKIESGSTKYYHQDHLSNRVVTDSSGNVLEQLGHYPFGESWYNASNDKLLFTSYELDAESGNDYAMMRSYVNRLGRFSSLDPSSGSIDDPQSLNRYGYVDDDVINLIDPWGLTPKQLQCSNMDPIQFLSCSGYSSSGGGGGECFIDGMSSPCGIVLSVMQAGATNNTLTGGSNGTFQTWTPGDCVTSTDNGNPGDGGGGEVAGSSSTSCENGYWSTITFNNSPGTSSGGSSFAIAGPPNWFPKGGPPNSGPYFQARPKPPVEFPGPNGGPPTEWGPTPGQPITLQRVFYDLGQLAKATYNGASDVFIMIDPHTCVDGKKDMLGNPCMI